MFRPYQLVFITILAPSAVVLGCQTELGADSEPDTHDDMCPPLDGDEPVELVVADRWRALEDPADDPLAAHRPLELVCPSSGWGEEFGALEARTAECNYLSVEQPLAAPLALGDTLRVRVWWQNLIALEPATGHLALSVDGELLWELEVAIPGDSDARELEFPSPVSAEAGAIVNFHLHNHGQNTWTLAELVRIELADSGCH